MTNTFNFNSRETYLTFRAEWRAKYKEVSNDIRSLKREMASRKGEDLSDEQRKLYFLRIRAHKLMVELEAAKEFKNAQLAARQSVEA